jgi:hypothetical protein
LQGIDLEKHLPEGSRVTPKQSSANTLPLFGAPEDYAHLNQEEKEALTQKMMGKHRSWVKQTTPKTVSK